MQALAARQCKPRSSKSDLISSTDLDALLPELEGWTPDTEQRILQRRFRFKDFYQTMAFVNAVAWIAQQQDHHPEMQVSYNQCHIHYTTHSIGGLSENDLICAAKINALLAADTAEVR